MGVFMGYILSSQVCVGRGGGKGLQIHRVNLTSLNTFSNTFAFFRPKPISLIWQDDIVK